MNFRVIDFDLLTRSFQPYVDGANKIEQEKKNLIDSIEPQKKEMESIIRSHTSGLIIDDMTQKVNVERIKEIQEELMKKDQEFKFKLKQMRDELNTSVYEQLSTFITDWAKSNNIDMVMGKMEVVYATDEVDATEYILNILKEKELYVPQPENEEV